MPETAILLATRNGDRFLEEQLDSYLWQTLQPSVLCASDDGSTDKTRAIISDFAKSAPFPVLQSDGPQAGPAQNFLTLLRNCPPSVEFAALSDQDDLWLPDKLAQGVGALADISGPALVCGPSVITDTSLKPLRLFPRKDKQIGFAHALAEGLAGGNTMILNRAAIDLVAETANPSLTTHDWWLYQLLTGVGGTVIYDPKPTVLYRQHRNNCVGAPVWYGPRLRRLRQIRRGGMTAWNTPQIDTLHTIRDRLTPENRKLLCQYRSVQKSQSVRAVWNLGKSGIRRTGLEGRLTLLGAGLSGQI